MAWDFKDIDIDKIPIKARTRSGYKELYDKIYSLKIGQAFTFDAGSNKRADNIRSSVSATLKKKGLSDKYIACNRLNEFYCGRVK